MKIYAAAALAASVLSLENGLAMTPQMGWNTWNKFACDISIDKIETAVD